MSKFPHFSDEEIRKTSFGLPDDSSFGIEVMSESFMNKLETARTLANIPFRLTCSYRTPEHDISKGRSGNSYHCVGRAVDIACSDSSARFVIVSALIKAGLHGIGIYPTFIHCDDRNYSLIWLKK